MSKHERDFNKFCRDKSGRPYLLLLQDYLFNSDNGKYIDTHIRNIYESLPYYVEHILVKEDSLFLKAFPTPASLAMCIRRDMYCPVIHDKRGQGTYLNTINERQKFENDSAGSIDDVIRKIIDAAFHRHFNTIFKDVNDVEVFLNELELANLPCNFGPRFFNEHRITIRQGICHAIANSPEFLKKLAKVDNDRVMRLCQKIPGLAVAIIRSDDFATRFPSMFDNVAKISWLLEQIQKFATSAHLNNSEVNEIKQILVGAITKSPKFIEELSKCDNRTKASLYQNLPGLEQAAQRVASRNMFLGLFSASRQGKLGRGINKDVMKILSRQAGHDMGATENDGMSNNKKPKK